jgi:UDP-galactopyranose mutase
MKQTDAPTTPRSSSLVNSMSKGAPSRYERAHAMLSECDLLCFSHLRWDFVFQRPQHLLTRFARHRNVYFVEEPIFVPRDNADLEISLKREGIVVVTPRFPEEYRGEDCSSRIRHLVDAFIERFVSEEYLCWYYTPMALSFTRHLTPLALVYDCMDELSLFAGAHPEIVVREQELLKRASLVFTGGYSLYREKKRHHASVYPFPSSIDGAHFGKARSLIDQPADQIDIPSPRVGFFGVIDERMDIELLEAIARARPDLHYVMIGPVVKIDPALLPKLPNIHYLGSKRYEQLPEYLAGWDVAMLPLALNDATRFISPTKTPEYLAGGVPVVSTPITDVVDPYGIKGMVQIAASPEEFVAAIDRALEQRSSREWLSKVDTHLATMSWDRTWSQMNKLILELGAARTARSVEPSVHST